MPSSRIEREQNSHFTHLLLILLFVGMSAHGSGVDRLPLGPLKLGGDAGSRAGPTGERPSAKRARETEVVGGSDLASAGREGGKRACGGSAEDPVDLSPEPASAERKSSLADPTPVEEGWRYEVPGPPATALGH